MLRNVPVLGGAVSAGLQICSAVICTRVIWGSVSCSSKDRPLGGDASFEAKSSTDSALMFVVEKCYGF